MNENAIELEHVTKNFRIYKEKKDSVFGRITNPFHKDKFQIIPILNDVSFNVKKGEMIGVIGRNGTGKTTLLRLLANIYKPDSGIIRTHGTIVPLLNLGIGFNPEQSARNNIILYGIILGLTEKEIKNKVESIIKFAEIEDFLDTELKNFSSGMVARLAFATAMQVNPDILLVDEILAVGDVGFKEKSYEAFKSFKDQKKTIVYVSHNLGSIKELCDKVLFLNQGKIGYLGEPEKGIEEYLKMMKNLKQK